MYLYTYQKCNHMAKINVLNKLLELGFQKRGKSYFKYINTDDYIKIDIVNDDIIRETTRHTLGCYEKTRHITSRSFLDRKQ